MIFKYRLGSIAAALALAGTAGAQALATFGSVEAAGLGESSALLGTSMSSGAAGLGLVGTLVGQTYRYRTGPTTTAQAYSFSPSVGLQNRMSTGAVQASIGYNFVHSDSPVQIIGVETGSSNSAFISGQGNYWGTGENTAQAIVNYAFQSEYYWTRFRAAHRLAASSNPVYLGGEIVFQGTQKTIPSAWRYQVGPTIEYRVTPDFRLGVSGGYRGGNNNAPGTGYVRIEFLALTNLSGK